MDLHYYVMAVCGRGYGRKNDKFHGQMKSRTELGSPIKCWNAGIGVGQSKVEVKRKRSNQQLCLQWTDLLEIENPQ
jgi:hypothetical protein